MMRRDKENRELRNRNRERMRETHNRLIEVGKWCRLPDISAEEIEHIRKNTVEKEKADSDKLFRLKLFEKCLRFAKLFEAYFLGVENVPIIHLRFTSLFIFPQTRFNGR